MLPSMPPVGIIILLVVLVIAVVVVKSLPALLSVLNPGVPDVAEPGLPPYRARPFLLSKGEAAFYHTLQRAVGQQYLIAAKVRLADVLTCSREAWKAGYGNKIIQKHLDFVLCDPATTRIVGAVELVDRSHNRADRQKRDAFLDAAMQAADIPLLHFSAAAHYDVPAVANTVQAAMAQL